MNLHHRNFRFIYFFSFLFSIKSLSFLNLNFSSKLKTVSAFQRYITKTNGPFACLRLNDTGSSLEWRVPVFEHFPLNHLTSLQQEIQPGPETFPQKGGASEPKNAIPSVVTFPRVRHPGVAKCNFSEGASQTDSCWRISPGEWLVLMWHSLLGCGKVVPLQCSA